jgi:hypothetical protein
METFKDYPENSRFLVSSEGRIYRELTKHNSKGYWKVILDSKRGQRKERYVHRMVLEAFMGPCPSEEYCGHHKNKDSHDNSVKNLTWMLITDHSRKTKTKLSNEIVLEIKRLYDEGYQGTYIASVTGVSIWIVRDIHKGKSWKWLKPEVPSKSGLKM